MIRTRLIPSLLLYNGGLVKTKKYKDHNYLGDPVNTIRIFNEKEVDELIVLDISATPNRKSPDWDLISDIASECFMPLGYGGGITSIDDIHRLFYIGIEKAIINTSAINNPGLIEEAARRFGSQSIVVSIDVKKNFWGRYEVYSQGGKLKTGLDPIQHAVKMEELGAGELILTSIDHDGMMQGYDIPIIQRVTSSVNIPVVACGGAGKLEDFTEAIRSGGASAVAGGSFFVYQGKHKAVLMSYPSEEEIDRIIQ